MTTTHSRARKGGQYGANGEWYKGGAFINTVPENPKGEAKKQRKGSGKQEFEPYKWEIAPEGKMSLFRILAGVEIFDRAACKFTFNPNIREGYFGGSELRAARVAAFNAGERWV